MFSTSFEQISGDESYDFKLTTPMKKYLLYLLKK